MTIAIDHNDQEKVKMDSDNNLGNEKETTPPLVPPSPVIDDGDIFEDSFPPLSSQPDIMSITPKQALFYLHQSLTSLIKLHENLLIHRNSPVVIDDDIMDSGGESSGLGGGGNNDVVPSAAPPPPPTGTGNSDEPTPSTGNVPPPSSSSTFHNARRRSHRYSDISPFSMSSRRKSSSSNLPTTSSNLNPMKNSSEEEDYDMLSPSSPGSLNSTTQSQLPSSNNLSFLRRQKKSTSLLAEAAEVASLVLQGGSTLQEEYSRIQKTMIHSSDNSSSLPSSPSTSPVSLRPSPSTGSVSSIQEQKLAIARRFWSKTTPSITVEKYLQRLFKYCPSSTSVYLSAGLYIYRLCIILQTIPLTELSVHRLVLAAIRIACKSIEDINHLQSRFAMAAGVSTADLYRLEIALLFLLDFNIKVDSDSLQRALEVWAEVEIQSRHVLDRPISSPIVG